MTFLRGALVEFMPTPLIPIPNVIIFQFNPESMAHTWTQPEAVAAAADAKAPANPMAVKGFPGEQFSFTIAMDSNDSIADGGAPGALAEISGVYSRVCAIEMLMYPSSAGSSGLLGMVTAALSSLGGAPANPPRDVPSNTMPIVLFVWGIGRIVPVRVTTLRITEKLYDSLLNPTHVEAELGLRVLTKDELAHASGDILMTLAKIASDYTFSYRQVAALANLANAADSIIGMLPH
jgi:hypothetical protein